MHIRPEAYKDKEDQSMSDNASTNFLEDIETKLGRNLTPMEHLTLSNPEESTDYDTIERI